MRPISLIIILVIIIIVVIVGIFYGYNVLNTSNKHISNNLTNITNTDRNLTIKPDVSQHIRVKIKIYNDQNIPTPAPFQQQILICYNIMHLCESWVLSLLNVHTSIYITTHMLI